MDPRESLAALIGVGMRTALRKAGRSRYSSAAYRAIDDMSDDEWADIVEFVADGLLSVPGPVAEMLDQFHEGIGEEYGSGDVDHSDLRILLHEDEHRELIEAFDNRDLPAIARELADVVYVAYGTAHSLGIPLDRVIAEVHAANMRKFGPDGRPIAVREDGKVLKPDGWTGPDVAAVLDENGVAW